MPQIAQVIKALKLLESKVYNSADLNTRVTVHACTQLLQELKSLRERFSLRAYVELYERAISLECIVRDSDVENLSQRTINNN